MTVLCHKRSTVHSIFQISISYAWRWSIFAKMVTYSAVDNTAFQLFRKGSRKGLPLEAEKLLKIDLRILFNKTVTISNRTVTKISTHNSWLHSFK